MRSQIGGRHARHKTNRWEQAVNKAGDLDVNERRAAERKALGIPERNKKAEESDDFHRRAVADYDPLPEHKPAPREVVTECVCGQLPAPERGQDDAAGQYRLAGHGLPLHRSIGEALARTGLAAVDAVMSEAAGSRRYSLPGDPYQAERYCTRPMPHEHGPECAGCEACDAEPGEPCAPDCIGQAAELDRQQEAREAQTVTIGQLIAIAAAMIGEIPGELAGDAEHVAWANGASELIRRAAGVPADRACLIDDAIGSA